MEIKQFGVGDVLLVRPEFCVKHIPFSFHPLTVTRVDTAQGTSRHYDDVEVKDLSGQKWTISANEAYLLHAWPFSAR